MIVGPTLAGATADITLREGGADRSVILIGAERELPYERQPLSKAYPRGVVPFDKALVRPAAFYSAHWIETMFGSPVGELIRQRAWCGSRIIAEFRQFPATSLVRIPA